MKKILKNALIPHKNNDYLPSLFKEWGVVVVIFISILLVSLGLFARSLLFSDSMLATVYPAIVASLTNSNREDSRLPNLKDNAQLEEAAKLKINDMMTNKYFAHTSPSGVEPWDWIKKAGYSYEYAGENLAINYSDSADVVTAWMKSPGHRANILNQQYTEIGVATAKTYYGNREVVFVVEMFGKPSSRSVSVLPQPLKTINQPISTSTLATTTRVLGVATTTHSAMTGSYPALAIELISHPRNIIITLLFVLLLMVMVSFLLFLRYVQRHHISHVIYALGLMIFIILACIFIYFLFVPKIILATKL